MIYNDRMSLVNSMVNCRRSQPTYLSCKVNGKRDHEQRDKGSYKKSSYRRNIPTKIGMKNGSYTLCKRVFYLNMHLLYNNLWFIHKNYLFFLHKYSSFLY